MMHWKERAIKKSEAITDAWEIVKIYMARLAEWILFGCMIANIIEILPGVVLWAVVSNAILGIQAITLDIAGFGLASMADHAEGEKDKRNAKITGWFLIGLMLVTLVNVSVGLLFPETLSYTLMIDKGLILARVGMTVIYGHVVHNLRRHSVAIVAQLPPQPMPDYSQLLNDFRSELLPEITALIANHTHDVDYAELASVLAPMMIESKQLLNDEEGDQVNEELNTDVYTVVYPEEEQVNDLLNEEVNTDVYQSPRTTDKLTKRNGKPEVNQTVRKSKTSGDSPVKQIQRLLRKNPDMGPTELAARVGCTKGYASQIRTQILLSLKDGGNSI